MGIHIRDAVRADAAGIAAAHIASWRRAYTHIFPASIFDAPDFDRSRVEMWESWTHSPTPDRRLVVATEADRVVGFAHTGFSDEPRAESTPVRGELFGFYTHPDVWGSGAAPELMGAAIDALGDLGVDRAVVWTLTDAHRARAFYGKTGWSLTGRTGMWDRYPDVPVSEVELERRIADS